MTAATKIKGTWVSDLKDDDVLLGRGQPILNYPGNLKFRQLVKDNKQEYLASGKHAVKDEIARRIVKLITERGGRFLRKVDDQDERDFLKVPESVFHAWHVVDEQTSLQKVKQALREHPTKNNQAKRAKKRALEEVEGLKNAAKDLKMGAGDLPGGIPPTGLPPSLLNPTDDLIAAARLRGDFQQFGKFPGVLSQETLLQHHQALAMLHQQRRHQALSATMFNPALFQQQNAALLGQQAAKAPETTTPPPGTAANAPAATPQGALLAGKSTAVAHTTQTLDNALLQQFLQEQTASRQQAILILAQQQQQQQQGDAAAAATPAVPPTPNAEIKAEEPVAPAPPVETAQAAPVATPQETN